MRRSFLRILLSQLILLILFTFAFQAIAQERPDPPAAASALKSLPATVTWLGNSFPGDGLNRGVGNFFPATLQDIAVSSDGTVMTVSHFNEALPPTVFIRNGQFIRSAPWQFEAYSAGYDPDANLFIAGVTASGGIKTGPQPLSISGAAPDVPWYATTRSDYWVHEMQGDKAAGGKPAGLAFAGDRIFVSDQATGNIRIWSKAGQNYTDSIPIGGTTRLQMAGGFLWAIQGDQVVRISLVSRAIVGRLAQGDVLTPVSLTADKAGRLVVGDAHPSRRNIVLFDSKTGKKAGEFGKPGGPWGPGQTPGRSGNAVFEYPLGLGVDAAGNLYVADAGGGWPQNGSITAFKPLASGKGWGTTPLWQVRGSSWSDTIALDPNDTSVAYSAWYKYKLDYNAPAGKGWTVTGSTFDKGKYPQDSRFNTYTLGRYFRGLRVIEGRKFLFSGKMDVFRLGDSGAGDVAVPCAVVLPRSARFEYGTPGWPQFAPSYGDSDGWLWTDANKDGQFQASEYRRFGNGEFHAGEWSLWMYLDDAANIWLLPTGDKRAGFYHRMQGLRNDAPVYDDVNQRTAARLPSGDGLGQINYSCLNEKTGDLLVLSRRDGRSDMSLTCYADWRALALAGKGESAPIRYRVDGIAQGPAINTDGGYSGDFIGGLRAKNEFLFLADAMGAGIRVYRVDSGEPVGRIDAGELGARQPMDNTEGLQVSTRGAGKSLEYVIVRDCWLTNKMLMFRWKP